MQKTDKTVQLLLRELFFKVRIKGNKNGKRSLVLTQSPLMMPGPTVICPIRPFGVNTSIGFSVDYESITHFYLFNTETPHLEEYSRKNKIVFELQGGKIEGFGKEERYVNKIIPIQYTQPLTQTVIENGKETNVYANYPYIIALIQGELGNLIATREFILKENIDNKKVLKLSRLNDNNYKNLNIIQSDTEVFN